jgi:hypothetical protein
MSYPPTATRSLSRGGRERHGEGASKPWGVARKQRLFFFPRSLYTLGKAYACKARSECDSVWASAPGIGHPGSASKPLWHREETLKIIHGYATWARPFPTPCLFFVFGVFTLWARPMRVKREVNVIVCGLAHPA